MRSGSFVEELGAALDELRAEGAITRVLFLDAADDVLVRRYVTTRRKHPLAADDRVSDGIAAERVLLEELKGRADLVIDTSDLNVHELRDRLVSQFGDGDRATGVADERRVVRLQARPAARRRPRVRLPLPAQPALGRLVAAAAGHRRRGARLRDGAAGDGRVPRRDATAVRVAAARVRARGQGVPVDRRGLHRRASPQRGDGGGARGAARRPRVPRARHAPRRRS